MSNTYILYNPHSGNGSGKAKAETFAATCGDAALLDLTEVCADYKALFDKTTAEDRVIICGGDGTLNRFVNEVEGLEIPCDILYYATGTGNDFLRDMGKEEGAAPFSVKEILQDLPIVTVNGKEWRFLNGVGYGIDGYCCEIGDQLRAKGDGKPINYTAIAIKGLLFHYKPTNARITVDGKIHTFEKVWIAPTMVGRYYGGGMMPAPAQRREDRLDHVSVGLMYHSGKLGTLMNFPNLFKGEHLKKEKSTAVLVGKEIRVEFDRPVALQIDGETVLNVSSYEVRLAKPAERAATKETAAV